MGNIVVTQIVRKRLLPTTGLTQVLAYITGSSSYATAGDLLTARQLGLKEIWGISCMVRDAADRHFKPNIVTDTLTSVKLIAANAAGTEETATTDITSKKGAVLVLGK